MRGYHDTSFILHLIEGKLNVTYGNIKCSEKIFFLTEGFIATEYVLLPTGKKYITDNKIRGLLCSPVIIIPYFPEVSFRP